MTLYFSIPDSRPRPAWWDRILYAAGARSGLVPQVVNGIPYRLKLFWNALIAQRRDEQMGMRMFLALGLMRWPVLLDAMSSTPPTSLWPLCCLDWDILVCQDLKPWLAKFEEFDYCTTSNRNGMLCAPYLLKNVWPLETFCTRLKAMVDSGDRAVGHIDDMTLWNQLAKENSWKVGDMNQTLDGQTFDNNIGEDGGRFLMMSNGNRWWFQNGHDVVMTDGVRKEVEFEEGHAYLVERSGARVETVALHLWDGFKAEIEPFVKALGI